MFSNIILYVERGAYRLASYYNGEVLRSNDGNEKFFVISKQCKQCIFIHIMFILYYTSIYFVLLYCKLHILDVKRLAKIAQINHKITQSKTLLRHNNTILRYD